MTQGISRFGMQRTLTVVLKHGDHLVDCLLWRMASALALADLLGVSTTLGDEIVDVQHTVCSCVCDVLLLVGRRLDWGELVERGVTILC